LDKISKRPDVLLIIKIKALLRAAGASTNSDSIEHGAINTYNVANVVVKNIHFFPVCPF
jgi:hypothetical protein